MNKEREEIERQINETPLENLIDSTPKKSKWNIVKEGIKDVAIELIFWPYRFVGAILGVSKDNISHGGSSSSGGHSHHSGSHSHQHSPSSSFRESHRFDPSRAYMERIQEKAYFKMVDGKGDHDCDHEH